MFTGLAWSGCGGFTIRPERVTHSVVERSPFGGPPWVDTAVVDLQVVGIVGSAGWFSETGVETLGGVWFTGSALS